MWHTEQTKENLQDRVWASCFCHSHRPAIFQKKPIEQQSTKSVLRYIPKNTGIVFSWRHALHDIPRAKILFDESFRFFKYGAAGRFEVFPIKRFLFCNGGIQFACTPCATIVCLGYVRPTNPWVFEKKFTHTQRQLG